MKTAIALAVAIAAVTSIPLLAQDAGANADAQAGARDNAKTTYAPTGGGYGDQAASHAYEMSSVTGDLDGKLDSKNAKVGDRVVLKTTDKVQTSDGTVIPRGTRLVGHVTEVQAYDKEHGAARMAIAFDRAELKNGQSLAIHTLIRGVNTDANAMSADSMSMNDGEMMGAPTAGGGHLSGGRSGGLLNGATETVGGVGGMTDRTIARTGETTGTAVNSTTGEVVQAAGHGDLGLNTGAHAQGDVRATPHATGIPGVMLAGNSSSSGLLTASRRNIQFESGTQMQLGIVVDK